MVDIKEAITFGAGLLLPAFEWASKQELDGFEVLKHEWTTFIQAPDIMYGVEQALIDTSSMPISTAVQYVGIGNEISKKIIDKNFLGKYSKYGRNAGVGSFLTRLAMFGSHGSPSLPLKVHDRSRQETIMTNPRV